MQYSAELWEACIRKHCNVMRFVYARLQLERGEALSGVAVVRPSASRLCYQTQAEHLTGVGGGSGTS